MNPDEAYEQALGEFAAELLARPPANNAFLHDFSMLAEVVAYFGYFNSLTQTVLKLTMPGVPDTYQGMELPQLALVDPDNRRPVDFEQAGERLRQLQRRWHEPRGALLAKFLTDWRDGSGKLFVTRALLELRGELPELFAGSDYLPLTVEGEHRDHVLAFQRSGAGATVVVIVARWLAKLMQAEMAAPTGEVWRDTLVKMSVPAPGQFLEVFSQRRVAIDGTGEVSAAELFASFPAAVLVCSPAHSC